MCAAGDPGRLGPLYWQKVLQVGAHAALISAGIIPGACLPKRTDPDRPDAWAWGGVSGGSCPRFSQDGPAAPAIVLPTSSRGWSSRTGARLEVSRYGGLDILHQGLTLAVQEYPLPFVRRQYWNLCCRGASPGGQICLEWFVRQLWVESPHLDQNAIEELTRWMLNPILEYHQS